MPVTFAIITTVAAFAPLLFVAGNMGKIMRQIPVVVIAVLLMSLVEALLILPAHLSGKTAPWFNRITRPIAGLQRTGLQRSGRRVLLGLQWVQGPYRKPDAAPSPSSGATLTVAIAVVALFLSASLGRRAGSSSSASCRRSTPTT